MQTSNSNTWSVVTVPFPFTDTTQIKKRPALVVSTTDFLQATNHLTLCMITSAKNSAWYNDIPIKNLEMAGLPSPSVIRLKVFTLEASLILRTIGTLDETDKDNTRHAIRHMLDVG